MLGFPRQQLLNTAGGYTIAVEPNVRLVGMGSLSISRDGFGMATRSVTAEGAR
jgi:hypothetical protein